MLAEDYLGISNPGIDTALIFDNNGAGTEVAFLWLSAAAFIDRTGDLRLGGQPVGNYSAKTESSARAASVRIGGRQPE